jgi:hypothetical protein
MTMDSFRPARERKVDFGAGRSDVGAASAGEISSFFDAMTWRSPTLHRNPAAARPTGFPLGI